MTKTLQAEWLSLGWPLQALLNTLPWCKIICAQPAFLLVHRSNVSQIWHPVGPTTIYADTIHLYCPVDCVFCFQIIIVNCIILTAVHTIRDKRIRALNILTCGNAIKCNRIIFLVNATSVFALIRKITRCTPTFDDRKKEVWNRLFLRTRQATRTLVSIWQPGSHWVGRAHWLLYNIAVLHRGWFARDFCIPHTTKSRYVPELWRRKSRLLPCLTCEATSRHQLMDRLVFLRLGVFEFHRRSTSWGDFGFWLPWLIVAMPGPQGIDANKIWIELSVDDWHYHAITPRLVLA